MLLLPLAIHAAADAADALHAAAAAAAAVDAAAAHTAAAHAAAAHVTAAHAAAAHAAAAAAAAVAALPCHAPSRTKKVTPAETVDQDALVVLLLSDFQNHASFVFVWSWTKNNEIP